MRYQFVAGVILTILSAPAWAQTQVWSQAPQTQIWSEAPKTQVWSQAPKTQQMPQAPRTQLGSQAPGTQVWSSPTYTQRRSDEDIRRQVDGIVRNVERNTRGAYGTAPGRPHQDVQGQVWRDHMNRTRAQEQFQREQDAYYDRQRYYNPR